MQQERNPNFWEFIWKNYKVHLQIAAIAIILQWIIFKQIYPFPNFRGDSASYIGAALTHADATEWPVGYSKFLVLIHWFSHSDTLFVTIQYLLLELSALFFLFTLQYFIRPGKIIFVILYVFTVFNPVFLHLGNYIMSDGLFISLSLFWVSQLIWIIYRPAPIQIVCHAILLLCLFTVRYNAMFYPIVAALAIILSSLRPIVKVMGIGLSLLSIGLFVTYTESEFYKTNGIRQFAPFSGWQLANNALYMYQNIALSDVDKVPDRFRELDSLVRKSFITDRQQGLVLNPYIKDYYIWGGQGSPLEDYKEYRWKGDTTTDMFTKWAESSPKNCSDVN